MFQAVNKGEVGKEWVKCNTDILSYGTNLTEWTYLGALASPTVFMSVLTSTYLYGTLQLQIL